MTKKQKQPFRVKYFYIPNKTARDKAFRFLAAHLMENIHPLQRKKVKKRMKDLILKNKWIGQIVFDLKTGESEWKMKKNQNIKNYRGKSLKGEHIHKMRQEWSKDFKRLAHNFIEEKKQDRKNERKEKNKIKSER
jgi:hypothetical protein